MDLYTAIQELVDEKKRLDAVIASLEARQGRGPAAPKKRGRKSMSAEERAAVSRRMAAWWAARRGEDAGQTAGLPGEESAGEQTADEAPPEGYTHSMAAAASGASASFPV